MFGTGTGRRGVLLDQMGLVVGGPFKVTGVMGQARLVIDTNTESALPQAVVNQRDRCDVVRQ